MRKPDNRSGRPPRRDEHGGNPRDEGSRGRDRRPGGDAREERPATSGPVIFGVHAVREALRSPRRRIKRLLATAQAAERLAAEISARGLTPVIVAPEAIAARLAPDTVHQGLLAEVDPLPPMDIDELPANGLVLVLDQVTDPHNFGAILRTAAAFRVDAVIFTERHSPALNGVVAKSASGALEHVPLCHVVNLARAMEKLEDLGYRRVGLDSDAQASLADVSLARPLALVLGAEGKGLRRLTRENCDDLARLDLPGAIRSLNVSNACACALTHVLLRGGAQ